MMTGDKPNKGKKLRVRTEYPDELEVVGPGPNVVLTQSPKMSIYGPKFHCGPLQLRRQRLLEKMKKEADDTMKERMDQLEKECKARELKLKMEQMQQQQAALRRKTAEGNKDGLVPISQYQPEMFQYQPEIHQFQPEMHHQYPQYQGFPQYYHEMQQYPQLNSFNQYPEYPQYPMQFPQYHQEHQTNFYANKS